MAEYTITEEDYELATSINLNIENLRDQYDEGFGITRSSSRQISQQNARQAAINSQGAQ